VKPELSTPPCACTSYFVPAGSRVKSRTGVSAPPCFPRGLLGNPTLTVCIPAQGVWQEVGQLDSFAAAQRFRCVAQNQSFSLS